MEVRKAKMIVNTSGAGSSTFRATLPSSWVRKMGLDEEKRNLKLYFDGGLIIIKNNEEEIRMLKKLLQKAEVKIQEEIERFGFIDDSDYSDRFLDNLALELAKEEILKGNEDINFYYEKEYEIEELQEELLKMIKDEVMINYDSIGTTNERGDYSGCWYKDLKGLVNWADTWQENSLQEAYEEFINTYDVDITLKQFAEAYEVDLEDYLDRILEKLLGLAKVEIEKEMNRLGYIDDSDNADRFLDKLAKNLVEKELVPDRNLDLYYEKEAEIEELAEELLEMIKDEVIINYDSISTTNERGDYSGCWYKDLKGLVNWADTWQENSLQEAYEEFINTYDVDITLEQFAEAYGVDLEDYLDE